MRRTADIDLTLKFAAVSLEYFLFRIAIWWLESIPCLSALLSGVENFSSVPHV